MFEALKDPGIISTNLCRRIALSVRSVYFSIKPTDALISKFILVRDSTLHVSGSSSTHHQELVTVHSAMARVIQ